MLKPNLKASNSSLLLLSGLLCTVSMLAHAVNRAHYHYVGSGFFPKDFVLIVLIVLIFNIGLALYYPKGAPARARALELLYFIAVLSVLAFASGAAQLTPFTPVDGQIIALESGLGIHVQNWVSFLNQFPFIKSLLILIYESLPYQMSLIPLGLIAIGSFDTLRVYYFLLLFTALVGFSIYYFFPTLAPASVLRGTEFMPEQFATGLKFYQIHHHIPPTTDAGGLIAFPSFHVIWALLCVYLLKDWRIPFVALAVVNFFLVASCVLLGWHYVLDVAGGLVLCSLGFMVIGNTSEQSREQLIGSEAN
jgi:hypothetical protein